MIRRTTQNLQIIRYYIPQSDLLRILSGRLEMPPAVMSSESRLIMEPGHADGPRLVVETAYPEVEADAPIRGVSQ